MVNKTSFETDINYEKRKWFIKNYKKTFSKDSEEEAERLSEIWINMTILKCRYPDALEKKIYNFLKNVNK